MTCTASPRKTLAEIMSQTEEVGDCLEWTGFIGTKGGDSGKPMYKWWNGRYSANVPVCREVWALTNGPIPAGKIVYRLCCNDRCIGCLALGQRGDPMRRRKKLGLTKHSPATRASLTNGARGRANVKHTIEQAREVRDLISAGLKVREIVERTGMPEWTVSDIRSNRSWKETSYASSVFSWRPGA